MKKMKNRTVPFNVSESPVKLRDLVKIYEEVIGRKLPIEWGGRTYRNREVMMPWNKGRLLPGWSVRIGVEEEIRKIGLSGNIKVYTDPKTSKLLKSALERNQDE